MNQRNCLVTGGSSGIGRELVDTLLKQGHRVGVFDCQPMDRHPIPNNLFFQFVNVTDENQVQAGMTALHQRWGLLHAAFNVAGHCPPLADLTKVSRLNWRQAVDTNFKGTWLCLKHQLPLMDRTRRPAIVNFASTFASFGAEGLGPYIASKAALIELTRAAAREATGVRVNVICPGLVNSPMVQSMLLSSGRPDLLFISSSTTEVVEAAVWLVSPAAAGINSQSIEVGQEMRAF